MTIPLEKQFLTGKRKRKWKSVSLNKKKNTRGAKNLLKRFTSTEAVCFAAGFVLFFIFIISGVPQRIIAVSRSENRVLSASDNHSVKTVSVETRKAAVDIDSFLSPSLSGAHPFSRTHIVSEGETISVIAGRYNLKKETVLQVNHFDDLRKIKPGTELSIPSVDGIIVKIEKKDTLEKITERYALDEVSFQKLKKYYAVLPEPGTEIFIPGASLPEEKVREMFSSYYIYPLYGSLITEFGKATDPATGLKTTYDGIDIAAKKGSAVSAARSW